MHYLKVDGQEQPSFVRLSKGASRVPGLTLLEVITLHRPKLHVPLSSPFFSFPCSPGPRSPHLVFGMVTQQYSFLLLLLLTAVIKRATTYPILHCVPGTGLKHITYIDPFNSYNDPIEGVPL